MAEIRVAAWLGSGESCLPGMHMGSFSPCPRMVERGAESKLSIVP